MSNTPEVSSRGASQSRVETSHRFGAYLRHHRESAAESIARLVLSPLQSLLTWLVIAIALALPAVFYVGLNNLQSVGENWQGSGQISVFLDKRARSAAIEKLQAKLERRRGVSEVSFVSPEQALSEFKSHTGFGKAIDNLDENPLPPVFLIQTSELIGSSQSLGQLVDELKAEPVVDDVLIDMQWVERLHQLLALFERAVMVLAALLAFGLLLALGNTIRLEIENRRDEIVVVKLVGGSNAFVRRPFLYTGLWYGLFGGILAAILVSVALSWLATPVDKLANLYQSQFTLNGLALSEVVLLLCISCLMGWIGAWIATARHLRQIEPK